MKGSIDEDDVWCDDRLGYSKIGAAFTNIVKSISDSKVISIEAPFGHGKTFFRERWTKELEASGERVIAIDAQQSDHSGDPLITFMGALLSEKSREGEPLSAKLKNKALQLGGLLGRSTLRVLLRNGAEELIEAGADWVKDKSPDIQQIDESVDELKEGLSKAAGHMIATHLAAEHARIHELPEQIDSIRDTLTDGYENNRIIIIIDELDRCRPEYAILLLESLKLVFGRQGFVFCLMVNHSYLESIAHHRLGTGNQGELYLEKFIDLRLRLKPKAGMSALLAEEAFKDLSVSIPYGDVATFGPKPMLELLVRIVENEGPSIRQIKRAYERMDLLTRMYREHPIDLPLLMVMTFEDALAREGIIEKYLPRGELSPESISRFADEYDEASRMDASRLFMLDEYFDETFGELVGLAPHRYGYNEDLPAPIQQIKDLAPRYISAHRRMLDGVMEIQV
ncbi:P-loop NTPase fold protein [Celeribacter sp. PS-C1]|uniref:KAP family P-loop NTPase fold protein n=1 Tax=Celeribacter sp. PS-C1 TaxID=2820813 RepID=UPI001CA553AB|nr:P-loop NTPase fold protein [Celeribacter sp. PS-C1]MBW6419519.1 KAP family NTPase [Celeribacter sp. PS-C1]